MQAQRVLHLSASFSVSNSPTPTDKHSQGAGSIEVALNLLPSLCVKTLFEGGL